MTSPRLRFTQVTLRLLPFLLSFLRDWKCWLVFGGPRPLTEEQHRERARRLRRAMAKLGPTFIKGAQVFGMREDLVPVIYCEELKKLQDRVPPFPASQARAVFRASVGRGVEEVFDSFEDEPIAAASLGQVHKAKYKGRWVAVKLLRPGVIELVETDLKVVRVLLAVLDVLIDPGLMNSFHAIVEEYDRMIHQESDFRNERECARRLRENFRGHPQVRIPGCIGALTTRRTSVFEYVDGVRIDEKSAVLALGMTPKSMAQLLIDSYVRMAVVHGFVHADPHAGNLLVDAQGRLVILDYGMFVEFDESMKMELLHVVNAIVRGDVDRIVEAFYNLDMVNPGVNRAVLRDAANTLLSIQLRDAATTRQIREIAIEVVRTFYRFPVKMPSNLVYLFRASALVEGICVHYDPNFNSIREATPVVKGMLREIAFEGDLGPVRQARRLVRRTMKTLRGVESIVERLDREELHIRLSERDLLELEGFLRGFMRRLLAGIAFATVAAVGGLAYLRDGSLLLLLCTAGIATLGFLFVALAPMSRRRLKASRFDHIRNRNL